MPSRRSRTACRIFPSQREELLAGNADMQANLIDVATFAALAALLISLFWLVFNYLIKRRIVAYLE